MPLATPFEPVAVRLRDGSRATIRICTEEDARAWVLQHQARLREYGTDDADWDWASHAARAASTVGLVCLCLESGDQTQGLIVFGETSATGERSRCSPGASMVYVEYIAVRPENREPPVGTRAVRGVGILLVGAAVRVAVDLGFGGRVGLHSAAGAEQFYPRLGFQPVGREVCTDGEWLYFEHAGDDV